MKRFLMAAAAMLALTGMGQVAMRKLEDLTNTNLVCVTDYGPQVVSLTQRVTGLEGNTNDWSKTVLNLAALSNNVASLSSRVDATNALFSAWFSGLQSRTSYWDTAYSWGDWSVAVASNTAAIAVLETNTVTRAGTNGWEVGSHASFLTSAPPQSVVSVNGQTGAVVITAESIGALTNETDLAALRTYHYGSPDIIESPAEWFVFDGVGTITAFNWEAGRENVVIPWAIGGVPVTAIGADAFVGSGIVSVIAPQTVTMIGSSAFVACESLTSVSLPQAQTIGEAAFGSCGGLTSISMPQVQTVGDSAFGYCDSLASISLPQVQTIGNYAFGDCLLLASVSLPQAQTIRAYAFYACGGLTSVSLPQAQTVEAFAFGYCDSLASISMPQAQTIGEAAFANCISLTSVSLPQAQTVEAFAFGYCDSLASISMPQVQTVGNNAFGDCLLLASVYFDNDAPTIRADIFSGLPANQVTNYVTNPQATGWGATLGDMPVVRLPLYTDAMYQAGELVATTGHVAQAIAAIPVPDMSDHPTFAQIAASNALPYTAWTGTVTPADGTATVAVAHGNMPVLVTTAPCVLTLDPTGYGTAGVSRVSLSYYTGTNSFTFATNIIGYAATPNVDTNGWNTLLIRRVSDGAWKGVGL